ncbi:type II toxin-antitoxin system MqsR family toxin [Ligilactobacillus sp. Marseille-Q7487]|uniref:type II toxin-antitoxin system MqsR family toxin n=1 Tax=Ligilactobacillus sp. Marseille-Q7487 TaxID=3022128 RepID=UPI0024A9B557|nr:type II toxin-antitoxin system MqsR family toxin [Ligilactobacillus sp. Marseille-Q7487]
MKKTKKEVEAYLNEVKKAIREGNYQISRNKRREDNNKLFWRYMLNEAKARKILLSLTVQDFSQIVRNHHPEYEYELLYIFGKEVELLERTSENLRNVSLYIKINKLDNQYVIIISFHEQKYQLNYPFK